MPQMSSAAARKKPERASVGRGTTKKHKSATSTTMGTMLRAASIHFSASGPWAALRFLAASQAISRRVYPTNPHSALGVAVASDGADVGEVRVWEMMETNMY